MKKNNFSAIDIAKWFLLKNEIEQKSNILDNDDYEVYEGITHLKLQKLIYFSQGIYLAYTGKPLFNEKVVAWEHGPVVKEVYDKFKHFKRTDISIHFNDDDISKMSDLEENEKIINVLEYVYRNYGGYTAWQLREMSHIQGGPWQVTVSTKGMNSEITKETMKKHFERYVKTN